MEYCKFCGKECKSRLSKAAHENKCKLKKDAFVFSADVYFDCDTIECSAKKIKEEESEYQTYTSLHMFHWDQWR